MRPSHVFTAGVNPPVPPGAGWMDRVLAPTYSRAMGSAAAASRPAALAARALATLAGRVAAPVRVRPHLAGGGLPGHQPAASAWRAPWCWRIGLPFGVVLMALGLSGIPVLVDHPGHHRSAVPPAASQHRGAGRRPGPGPAARAADQRGLVAPALARPARPAAVAPGGGGGGAGCPCSSSASWSSSSFGSAGHGLATLPAYNGPAGGVQLGSRPVHGVAER